MRDPILQKLLDKGTLTESELREVEGQLQVEELSTLVDILHNIFCTSRHETLTPEKEKELCDGECSKLTESGDAGREYCSYEEATAWETGDRMHWLARCQRLLGLYELTPDELLVELRIIQNVMRDVTTLDKDHPCAFGLMLVYVEKYGSKPHDELRKLLCCKIQQSKTTLPQ